MLLIVRFHANIPAPPLILTLSPSALSGAFGSGAAFAFEDAYVLAQALVYTHARNENISEALRLYDEVRSPHYKNLVRLFNSLAWYNSLLACS